MQLIVTSRVCEGSLELLSIDYPTLVDDMQIGGKIMLADGLIALEVVAKKNATELLCTVLNDGTLGEKKNVNLPGVIVRLPALAQKDEDDLRF